MTIKVIILLLNIYLIYGDKIYTLTSQRATITIGLGQPDYQLFTLGYDFSINGLYVIDSDCGKQIKCPKYCSSFRFQKIYCTPLCGILSVQEKRTLCNSDRQNHYNSSKSNTFVDLKTKFHWTNPYVSPRILYGTYTKDQLALYNLEKTRFTIALNYSNFEFIRIKLGSPRFFEYPSIGVIGLAPHENSLVNILYREGEIAEPKISISKPRNSLPGQPINSLTLGGFSNECTNWTYHPSMKQNLWSIDVKLGIMNNNITFEEKSQLIFDANFEQMIELPLDFAVILLKNKLLVVPKASDRYQNRYLHPKNSTLKLKLVLDGYEWSFDLSSRHSRDKNNYYSNIKLNRLDPPYKQENLWKLGGLVIWKSCIGFDYSENVVALGVPKK